MNTPPDAPPRADLLALTPDTLAALANRGLVKRAAKDVDSGAGPQVECAADGSVLGVHPDGSRPAAAAGWSLDRGRANLAM
ncbi:hypothetical protein ABZ885_40075, partial [Kitasatospora sp. NPDC047058]